MQENIDIAGSVQRGEHRLSTVLQVRLLEKENGDQVLRASYLTLRGDFFHKTWTWPKGRLAPSVLEEIGEDVAVILIGSLMELTDWIKGLRPV